MTDKEILRELASLPPEGQRQVAEFIAFLREQYSQAQQTGKPETADLAQEGFIGIWREREDMQDSSAWVRSSREREWVKHSG
jgi:DNA-directed RNA polymerase specialized sigma24 family protein